MELRHLRYFAAVAATENVSQAALKLHVSQPALSRQIRDLEEELGFELFERSAKSVRLTATGKVFQDEVHAILQRVDEALVTTRAFATSGNSELHVGYAPSLTVRILPSTLRAFQNELPKVRVKLHDLSTEKMLAGLREGQLQIAFLVLMRKAALRSLHFEQLTRDPLRLAVAPHHPFARRRSVTREVAAREPFVAYSRIEYPEYHDLLSSVFLSSKGKPHIAEEHDDVSALISSVQAGNGVALVPKSTACIAGERLKLISLTPAPPPLIMGLVSPKSGLTSTVERFSHHAKAAAAEIT